MSWFGNQDADLYDVELGNCLTACKYTCNGNGAVQSLSAKIKNTSTAKVGVIGLYTNKVVAGKDYPDAKVCQTAQFAIAATSTAWYTVNTSTNPNVVNGTVYWIAVNATGTFANMFLRWSSTPWNNEVSYTRIYNATMPDPYPSGQLYNDVKDNVYCTYTPSAPTGQPYISRVQQVYGMHSWIR